MAAKMRYSRAMIKKAILGDPDVTIKGKDGKLHPQLSSRGVKSTIYGRLGCTRQTLDNYLARYPDLAALIEVEGESIIDLAESQLLVAMAQGDMRAILFVLETKGKRRGWSKRTEITGADGVPLGLPDDVIAIMRGMGVEPTEAVNQFVEMIRRQAEVSNGQA